MCVGKVPQSLKDERKGKVGSEIITRKKEHNDTLKNKASTQCDRQISNELTALVKRMGQGLQNKQRQAECVCL